MFNVLHKIDVCISRIQKLAKIYASLKKNGKRY